MDKGKTSFSHIVCSKVAVRTALPEPSAIRTWWRCVLALHGKPVHHRYTEPERIACIAAGFKFYAHLYRLLAVLFLLLSPCAFFYDLGANARTSLYWSVATLLAGLYLWSVSGLGYVGALAYRGRQRHARVSLLSFMVMIVAFLSAFVAAISMVIEQFALAPIWANLTACSLLFVFGIGSYFIEIIYLATDHSLSRIGSSELPACQRFS